MVIVQTGVRAPVGRLLDPNGVYRAPVLESATTAQTWQITPVTKAQLTVATIRVNAARAPLAFGGSGCVASAQATVTTQGGVGGG
jgi:hypothetical protein